MRLADPPPGQRRFYLDAGRVMVAGRFSKIDRVGHREATAEDLTCLDAFGRRVLATAQGYWDVSSFQWSAQRALAKAATAALVCLLFCGAAAAQDSPSLVAATWCPVISGNPEAGAPSCDAGLGLSLWRSTRWPRLGIAAGIGMQTVGAGFSWTVSPPGARPLSVILGAIAPHDECGIYTNHWALAIGATFSVGGST